MPLITWRLRLISGAYKHATKMLRTITKSSWEAVQLQPVLLDSDRRITRKDTEGLAKACKLTLLSLVLGPWHADFVEVRTQIFRSLEEPSNISSSAPACKGSVSVLNLRAT